MGGGWKGMGTAPALCPDLDASRFRSLAWGYPCDTQSDSRVSPEVTKLGHTFTHEWKDAPHQRPPPRIRGPGLMLSFRAGHFGTG